MLVSMKEILEDAHKNNYAVAAPNTHWEIEARAAILAAEEMNAPVILDVAFFLHPDIIYLGQCLTRLAEQSSVPVAINEDHGGEFSHAIAAIRAGFTGVMVDRSSLPFEENAAQVKEIVRIAHCVGVSVEAELGHVGQAGSYNPTDKSLFTQPEEAKAFVKETGVDSLAVAIGTSHGMYKGITPTLDFELLERLKKATNIPLVLHGGSGTSRDDLRKACCMGINKVNVHSELCANIYEKIKNADIENEQGYDLYKHIIDGYKERLCEFIEVVGSKDKAWKPESKGLNKQIVF